MKTDIKRQNFNVTPEQAAEIERLRQGIDASSAKDAILWAVRVGNVLVDQARQGESIYVSTEAGGHQRLIVPQLELNRKGKWTYLAERPHAWRRQLFIKGRRLSAFGVWMDMQVNNQTIEEAAADWDLPIEAVREAIQYCEENRELLEMEAQEEKLRLRMKGVDLGDQAAA